MFEQEAGTFLLKPQDKGITFECLCLERELMPSMIKPTASAKEIFVETRGTP
jgi:hypothetical protein